MQVNAVSKQTGSQYEWLVDISCDMQQEPMGGRLTDSILTPVAAWQPCLEA